MRGAGAGGCLAWPSPWAGKERGFRSPAGPGAPPVGQRRGRDAQTGGAGPPAVCMLKYSVKPVCGAAVWGTSGW